ncbi:MAG: hypothetical protein ABFD90_06090 [Phycisphaerales bacterium]
MRNEWIVASGVAIVLVLGLAGVGLCAQPIVTKPLADATILSGVDGKLVHADANDAWWFEFTAQVKGDKYEVSAGTRMKLLPSGTLELLIADVNDRYAPLYRLSAQVTRYQGTNFLLATYFLPLSKFKGDEKADDKVQKPEGGTVSPPVDPELGIPPEIVERLKNARPIPTAMRKTDDSGLGSKPAARDYVGRMLVNQVGLIQADDVGALERISVEALPNERIYASTHPRFYFTPYALGWNVSDVRYELLPCAALEEARRLQGTSIEPIRFNVAGLVTQFGGRQYLLLQRAAPVYNYGNFGR